MKTRLLSVLTVFILLIIPLMNLAQAPTLGTAADFVLFTSVGAVSNVGTTDRAKYLTHLTGNIGFQTGSVTGFGNVNGVIHSGDGASNTCAADLLIAYNFLAAAIPDSTIVNPVIGNDSTIKAGTYQLPSSASSLDLGLTLDAEGDPNAVFIFKMPAGPPIYAFSTSANSKIHLINGAQACNVYWFITGQVNMGTGTSMKGTIISGGAINMTASDTLEGRALTINGAITLDNGDVGLLAYTPEGCSSPTLTGPTAPVFVDSKCFSVFSSIGPVADDNFSQVSGNVGGNTIAPSNYDPLLVEGGIYGKNGITAAAATDLGGVYSYLNGMAEDIILTAPTLLGHNLVLTPHNYLLPAAATLTDTLYLDAMGNADAVFIIKSAGAFATTVNSNVKLINGTKAENVYWLVNGAVSIATNSIFNGTIVVSGAISLLSGAQINGRALTINGAVDTHSIIATLTPGCSTTSAPEITSEPTDQEACPGDSVIFAVVATGTDLTYQWRKGTDELIDGGNISGATSDSLIIFPVSQTDEADNYNVVVSGSIEPGDTSINVSLTVNDTPIIDNEPTSQTICAIGDSVSFIVEATGSGLSYQWRKGTLDLTDGVNIAGANSDTLTINPVGISDISDIYYVIVSGTCSPSDTSINVSLSENSLPNITTEPVIQTVCEGSSASFSVDASGTDVTYQWRKGTSDIIDGATISGANSNTITIDPVNISDASDNYYVVVSGTCSPNDTSINVSLVVNTAPNITIEPVDQTVCVGTPVTFSVTATGADLIYQWRKGDLNISDNQKYSGTNSETLIIQPEHSFHNNDTYNVIVSGLCSTGDTSVAVSFDVNRAPIIFGKPSSQSACSGSAVNLSVVAIGSHLTYQWRRGNSNLIDGINISGATSSTITIDNVNASDASDNYNVIVYGSCSPSDTSANFSLSVDTSPYILIESGNQTVCEGSSATLWVVSTGSDFTYQWRKGTVNLNDGGNIYGAKTSKLYINPVNISDAAEIYNLVIVGPCFADETSSNVSLIVATSPIIKNQPVDQIICAGGSASFSVEATGSDLTYQWRKGTINLVDNANISGATSNILAIDNVSVSDAANDYNVVVTGSCNYPQTSNNVSLAVDTAPIISIDPGNQIACAGSEVSLSVAVTGLGYIYQWRKGVVNITNGGNISGANSDKLTINPVTFSDAYNDYNVVITGTCFLAVNSTNVSLEVNAAPSITIEPADQRVCPEGTASFSVTATGTALSYQWRKGNVNIVNGGNISGANTEMLIIGRVNNSDEATNYNVVVTGTCMPGKTSRNVSLLVEPAPNTNILPANQTVCAGSSVSFSVTAPRQSYTYQWSKGNVRLVNGANISGANSAVLTINPVQISDAGDNYNVVINGICFSGQTSMNVALVVDSEPRITGEPSNQTTCAGNPVSFSVAATGTGISYQWRKGTVNLFDGGNISGVNTSTLIISPANTSDEASNYNVVVTGKCLSNKTSANVSLTINTAPNITSGPTDQTACAGSSATFTVAATGTGLTYQWRKGNANILNGGNISGANTAILTINPVGVSNIDYNYNVVVTGNCQSQEISKNVYLIVNTAPKIISEPIDQSFCKYGCSISYLVAATGTSLTYQWRNGQVNLTNGGNISGANSAMLTINPVKVTDVSLYYNVVVSGVCSPSITSEYAFLAECNPLSILNMDNKAKLVDIYPNPFTTSINIMVNDKSQINNSEIRIFNAIGAEVVFSNINGQLTTLETSKLKSGFYFYKVIGKGQIIQSGKLIMK